MPEPEFCDDCGERVGYYDPALPEGEKIVITHDCECVRRMKDGHHVLLPRDMRSPDYGGVEDGVGGIHSDAEW